MMAACSLLATEARSQTVVLTGGRLFDGSGTAPFRNATVVVHDGVISCIGEGDACAIPAGAERVTLPSDSFVLPGLVDAHVHFAQTGWFEGRPDTLDLRDLHPFDEMQAALAANQEGYFRSYLCSGVTSVFDVGGFPWSWNLREAAEDNPMAPHVAAAGPLITHAPREKLNLPGEQEMILLSDAEAGRAAVRYMAANDSDAVKVWFLRVRQGEEAEIDARVVAVADETRRQGLPLIVHATSLREAKLAVREGAHLLVHGVDDVLVDDEFLELLKQTGTIYTPTLLVSDGYLQMFRAVKGVSAPMLDDPNGCMDAATRRRILDSPKLADHPQVRDFDRDLEAYEARLEDAYERKVENLRRVHRAGIPIAMGTDAGNPGTFHGPSIYRELEAMQAAGIESSELLVMATQNGAKAMGRDDIGVLATGKVADLIVVSGNPFEDIAHLRSLTHVMRAGTLYAIDDLRAGDWDRRRAASYLDARADLWVRKSRPRQKLATACISCHTAMPYMLSRAALGSASPEAALFADVETRVAGWGDIDVWYDESRGEGKTEQSWATESVMNAVVLTQRDVRDGGAVRPETQKALEHMWNQQNDAGAWTWLHFGLGPWETDGSDYWAASLAAVAAMSVSDRVSPPSNAVAKLKTYLRAALSQETSLHNRVSLLWAASAWDGLLSPSETSSLVDDVVSAQRPDGGFRLVDLGPWSSVDGSPPGTDSDGYATAYTTFVLQQLGVEGVAGVVARGVSWLVGHQRSDGRWDTPSPNKDRSREEDFRRLLASDAATGFAVLALTHGEERPRKD